MDDLVYAGDLSPQETWDLLATDPAAQLVDVRTDAEFAYVGTPDLGAIGKTSHQICWKVFPTMDTSPDFITGVEALTRTRDQPLLFLCRSGVRSRAAASAMTARGFTRCYNITEGFEGDKDDNGHRGTRNGWKVSGLPWQQG